MLYVKKYPFKKQSLLPRFSFLDLNLKRKVFAWRGKNLNLWQNLHPCVNVYMVSPKNVSNDSNYRVKREYPKLWGPILEGNFSYYYYLCEPQTFHTRLFSVGLEIQCIKSQHYCIYVLHNFLVSLAG